MEMNNKPVVGQDVVLWEPKYDTYNFGYKVSKVTPGGRVTVKHEEYSRVFNKNGEEMGKQYSRVLIRYDVADCKRKYNQKHKFMAIASEIRKIAGSQNANYLWGKEGLSDEINRLKEEITKIEAMMSNG